MLNMRTYKLITLKRRDCPHKGEKIVLCTETNKIEAARLTNEAQNCAVLYSESSSTVAGKLWIDYFLEPFLSKVVINKGQINPVYCRTELLSH